MSPIIGLVNQKGGCGKTTTAVNLASAVAQMDTGYRVLLIDMDPQANATSAFGFSQKAVRQSIYDVLIESIDIYDTLVGTPVEDLDLVPSNIQLCGAEIELVSMIGRERRLIDNLGELPDEYDYVFIDCPPSLGLLTLNSLTAMDYVIIPLQTEYYALEGISQLMNTINLVKRRLNRSLSITGVLLTMYDARTNLAKAVADEVRDYFGENVYDTIIPRNVTLAEAPSHGKPIFLYAPNCRGAEAYRSLAKEVLDREW